MAAWFVTRVHLLRSNQPDTGRYLQQQPVEHSASMQISKIQIPVIYLFFYLFIQSTAALAGGNKGI